MGNPAEIYGPIPSINHFFDFSVVALENFWE
jgi:hypothetical protein